MNIIDLVAQLRAEVAECRSRSARFAESMREADAEAETINMMIDRFLETDEAKAATEQLPTVHLVFDGTRKPRRDIRRLVKDTLDEDPNLLALTKDERVSRLSRNLQCKPSQIEAALRALDGAAK